MRACASETHMGMSQEPLCVEIKRKNAGPQAHKNHFVWKFKGKKPDPKPGEHVLHEPAQSKRIWTFASKFTRKKTVPDSGHFVRAWAVETHMDISQEPFCVEIYNENAGPPGEHLD